jgi:hypothetical protein
MDSDHELVYAKKYIYNMIVALSKPKDGRKRRSATWQEHSWPGFYLRNWEFINFVLVFVLSAAIGYLFVISIAGFFGIVLAILIAGILMYSQILGPFAYLWGFKARQVKVVSK